MNFDSHQRVTAPVGTVEAIKHEELNFFESVTTAAAILGRLQRVGVGIGGPAWPMRDPCILAKPVRSKYAPTGRRLTPGPGVGFIPRSFVFMQLEFAARCRLYDEYLAVLHALWIAHHPFEAATNRRARCETWPGPGSDPRQRRSFRRFDTAGWQVQPGCAGRLPCDGARTAEMPLRSAAVGATVLRLPAAAQDNLSAGVSCRFWAHD
jgi:hypothetical protein